MHAWYFESAAFPFQPQQDVASSNRSSDRQIVPGEARDAVTSKLGKALGAYRFPLDSPHGINNASTTQYMHTCLLLATLGSASSSHLRKKRSTSQIDGNLGRKAQEGSRSMK